MLRYVWYGKGLIIPGPRFLNSTDFFFFFLRPEGAAWVFIRKSQQRCKEVSFRKLLGCSVTCIIKSYKRFLYVSSSIFPSVVFFFFEAPVISSLLVSSFFSPTITWMLEVVLIHKAAMNEQNLSLWSLILHVLVNEIKCITSWELLEGWISKTVKQCNFNLHFIGSEFTVQWMQDYCNLLCTKHLWKYSVNKIILKEIIQKIYIRVLCVLLKCLVLVQSPSKKAFGCSVLTRNPFVHLCAPRVLERHFKCWVTDGISYSSQCEASAVVMAVTAAMEGSLNSSLLALGFGQKRQVNPWAVSFTNELTL